MATRAKRRTNRHERPGAHPGCLLLAAAGGESFLKSILDAALHLRIPKRVVATTLAAFATSNPELTAGFVWATLNS